MKDCLTKIFISVKVEKKSFEMNVVKILLKIFTPQGNALNTAYFKSLKWKECR